MIYKLNHAALAIFLTTSNALAADVCSIAEKSFREAVSVYSSDGASAFMERILKNGPLEGDKRSLSQIQALGQIE